MTIEVGTPPEWMIALENKQKRHHKLAHEIGAGAPCLNCNDECLGLDLHFWRKICRNCKCKKEVHDVKEENNYEQFEILFGDALKTSDRFKQLSLNLKFKLPDYSSAKESQMSDSSSIKSDNDLMFDWIPVDVPANLASEYLQQLPLEKLPITGSAGAMFRRQQLQKQIPLHDFKTNDCHELTDEEAKAFSEYLDNLKHNAVGKGQITKILPNSANIDNDDEPSQYPSKLLAFSNNLNSSPKPFKSVAQNINETNGNINELPTPPPELLNLAIGLRTPSTFIPYSKLNSKIKAMPNIDGSRRYPKPSFDYETRTARSTPIKSLEAEYLKKMTINGTSADAKNNNLYSTNEINRNIYTPDKTEDNLTPSQIIRKLNSRQDAASPETNINANENQTSSHNVSRNVDGKFLKMDNPEKFVALTSYVSNTPQISSTLTAPRKIDTIRTPNVHFGANTLYSDEEMDADHYLTVDAECFCHQCKIAIQPGQVAVLAERAGVEVIWHPQCFVCIICKELLVDLVYFFHKGDVYCGRHYAVVLKIPRCYACDELIFLKEYTAAEGQMFHVKHFCCFECDRPLAGLQYIPKDNHPICLSCYEFKYSKMCHYCENIIKAGDSRVGWKELNWHATPQCFKCMQCLKSLLGGKFVVKNNHPLCSKECVILFESSNL